MKRISPDITDEAREALDRLVQERKQTMGQVISDLIMQAESQQEMVAQVGQYLAAIYGDTQRLCAGLLEKDPEPETAPVVSDAERYGTDWIQPVPPLPVPQKKRWFSRR